MISMPRLTKYLGAQASSSRLPEAKPWYACTGNSHSSAAAVQYEATQRLHPHSP